MAHRAIAQSVDELRPLLQLCREGRLYEVEGWIADGKPLQPPPSAIPKGTRWKTALQIALETGQHSLAALLLKSGYDLRLEPYSPLDLTLERRRWDLFDLLLEHGADLKSTDVYAVLNTYNTALYERFTAAGYDLTQGHAMGSVLGHGTSNRPLFGFAKRHRLEAPRIQTELNIALVCHAKEGNERGVALCLWAGADAHAPAPDLTFGRRAAAESEDDGDSFVGFTAIEEAASHGHLDILKRLCPDAARDDFDALYQYAKYESMVAFLATIQPPKDLTAILGWHIRWLERGFLGLQSRGTGMIEALLNCGVRWEKSDAKKLAGIRRSLFKAGDYDFANVMARLKRPEICSPETYGELTRSPQMQARLLALGLVKRPVDEKEKLRRERARLMGRYDRAKLYTDVWSRPAQDVAKSYGFSGVMLGKICRKLQVPVPPRGYWARVRSGHKMKKPPLPRLEERHDS